MRQAGLLLALLALVLKVSAPPGYMIEASGGRIIATLCSGAPVVLDLGGDTPDRHNGSDQSAPCPFAFAAHAAPPTPQITIVAPRENGWISAASPAVSAAATALAAPPPWARGPPTSI